MVRSDAVVMLLCEVCVSGNQQYKQTRDEEDELLQYAIQQSLLQDEGSGQEQVITIYADQYAIFMSVCCCHVI